MLASRALLPKRGEEKSASFVLSELLLEFVETGLVLGLLSKISGFVFGLAFLNELIDEKIFWDVCLLLFLRRRIAKGSRKRT